MAEDANKISVELQYTEVNKQVLENAKANIRSVENANDSAAKSFDKFGNSASGASSELAHLNNEAHEATAGFTRFEKNVTHFTAILFALKEGYEVLAAAIEYSHAAQAETSSFIAAEKAGKSLGDTITTSILSIGAAGQAGQVELKALRNQMDLAGTDSEKLRALTIRLLNLQGTTPLQVTMEQLRSQYKLEAALEDEKFADLQKTYGQQKDLVEKHYKEVLDIAANEYNSEFKALDGNLAARIILSDQYKIKTIGIEKARQAELDGIAAKETARLKLIDDSELDTTAKTLQVKLDQTKSNFSERILSTDQYYQQANELISRQELVEIAALDNTADKQQKVDQIRIDSARKRADVDKDLADQTRASIIENLEREDEAAKRKVKIQQDLGDSTVKILGAGADAAKLFGRKGFLAYKAFALAQAVVAGVLGVMNQLSTGDPYTAVFRAAAAAAVAAVQIATIAAEAPPSYAEGGLVPGSPSSHDNRIATVATGEYILDAASVSRAGAANVAAMHEAMRSGQFNFFGRGITPRPRSSSSFATGGMVGANLDGLIEGRSREVTVGFLNTRQHEIDFLRRRGSKIVIDQINQRTQQIAS